MVSSLIADGGPVLRHEPTRIHQPIALRDGLDGFVDVTTGSNDLYNVGEYSAGVGYDEASGLGSPDGAGFFAGLCPPKFDARRRRQFTVATDEARPLAVHRPHRRPRSPDHRQARRIHVTAAAPRTSADDGPRPRHRSTKLTALVGGFDARRARALLEQRRQAAIIGVPVLAHQRRRRGPRSRDVTKTTSIDGAGSGQGSTPTASRVRARNAQRRRSASVRRRMVTIAHAISNTCTA
jgi:hypothetical protein